MSKRVSKKASTKNSSVAVATEVINAEQMSGNASVEVQGVQQEEINALQKTEIVQNIELCRIICSPYNPRKFHSDEDLHELATSISNYGVIQPITIRPKDEGYEIVCGERRFRASSIANLKEIPAILKNYTDEQAMEVCIIENLQRKDISAMEEADSFGKLMELRNYNIEQLCLQFGKSDKYIRTRLQLRNLIDSIAMLVANDQISLGNAIELSKYCEEIQQDVYENHLQTDGYSRWTDLTLQDFRSRMERQYSTDISQYSFDKSECKNCPFNSARNDLFSKVECGNCQNSECLYAKQQQFVIDTTSRMLDENKNLEICVRPYSNASKEVVDKMKEDGYDIQEMHPQRFPTMPQAPVAENYETEEDYEEAKLEHEADVSDFEENMWKIEEMITKGEIQQMIDVSGMTPVLCYRKVVTTEELPKEDPIKALQDKDKRNKEISMEKTIDDIKILMRKADFPDSEWVNKEETLLYFTMLGFVRREQYTKLGYKDTWTNLTAEQKLKTVSKLTEKQKNLIRREFIASQLKEAYGASKLSDLLIEFAQLHFPERTKEIKNEYDTVYKKRQKSIDDKITLLKAEKEKKLTKEGEEQTQTDKFQSEEHSEHSDELKVISQPETEEAVYLALPEHAYIEELSA